MGRCTEEGDVGAGAAVEISLEGARPGGELLVRAVAEAWRFVLGELGAMAGVGVLAASKESRTSEVVAGGEDDLGKAAVDGVGPLLRWLPPSSSPLVVVPTASESFRAALRFSRSFCKASSMLLLLLSMAILASTRPNPLATSRDTLCLPEVTTLPPRGRGLERISLPEPEASSSARGRTSEDCIG